MWKDKEKRKEYNRLYHQEKRKEIRKRARRVYFSTKKPCPKCGAFIAKKSNMCIPCTLEERNKTEKQRRAVSAFHKGKPKREWTQKEREEQSKRLRGIKRTREQKIKYSLSQKGNKHCMGRKDTPQTIEKKKRTWTKDKRDLQSIRAKERITPEWIESVSSYREKNPMWRGGISNSRYKKFNKLLKDEILARDGYHCQLCDISNDECKNKSGHALGVHHIDFDKENSSKDNLIALCNRCNSKINHRREQWIEFFKNKLASINGNGRLSIIEDVKAVA